MKILCQCLVLLFLLTGGLSPGQDSVPFAGYFKLGEPVISGQNVQVTLTVRIRNCTGYDISNATVSLEDALLSGQLYGIFSERFTAAYGEIKTFEQVFIVPLSLFEQWPAIQVPYVRVTFVDGGGHDASYPVVLSRRWLDEER